MCIDYQHLCSFAMWFNRVCKIDSLPFTCICCIFQVFWHCCACSHRLVSNVDEGCWSTVSATGLTTVSAWWLLGWVLLAIKSKLVVFWLENNCCIIIIIITNENIKVMLSRKRGRGTLQDYNKEEISKCQSKIWTNRNVFSWCLNGTREETVRRDGGRLFRACGAATGKARSPRVDLCIGGTTSVVVVDEHIRQSVHSDCRERESGWCWSLFSVLDCLGCCLVSKWRVNYFFLCNWCLF